MKKLIVLVSFVIFGVSAFRASAQTEQWWDNNGASTASSGTWDTATTNWANSATLTASTAPFTTNNFAVFAAGSAPALSSLTITVTNAVTCEGIGDGIPSGVSITNLNFTGAGSINFPAGWWNIDCGNGVNNLYFNLPITGAGGVSQHNSGSLYLYGNNTYSGGTEETGGQIIYYNNNNSFGSGIITNDGGNAIYLTTNSTVLTITNPFYLNIGANIWDFGDGNTICSGPVYLYSTTQLKNNGSSTQPLTISGPISSPNGAYGLTLETPNSATITLSGANTYTGPTALGNGVIAFASVSSINSVNTPAQQPSSSLGVPSSVANGTIGLGSTTFASKLIYTGAGEPSDRVINLSSTTGGATIEMDGAGPLVLTSAFTATGAGSKTLTLQGSSTATNTIMGLIPNNSSANKTALTKAQAGNWILTGKNTFSGAMTVSGGTLTIGGAGDLGDSGGNGFYTNTISDTATIVFNSSASQTLGGVISGAGALQVIGSGSLTLTNANTYTGITTVGAGSMLNVATTGKLANTTPIALNGTINFTSTSGLTIGGLLSGSGAFNMGAVNTTETITNVNNTFSGLFTVTAGTISFNADGCLGTPPATVLANDITLNGGPQSGLRANANGITINPNRGITLGANGGEIQVAANDTCTYNGIISGSGVFQDGQSASTGLGVLVLGGQEAYTNATVIAAGTLRLAAGASLGNSSGIIMSNSATLDVSALNPFALSTTNTFTAIGGSNTTVTILGPAGGNANFGSQPVTLSFVPAFTTGDPTNAALTVSQGTLVLNGNTVNVTNASALTLDVGNYTLIQSSNGINVTAPLTLNYVGPAMVANTTASLAVVGNALVLQVAPAVGYAGTVFSNLALSQSVTYGTASATFSGTVSAAGPVYPGMGETVTITIPNILATTTTIDDAAGDFTLTVPINTVPVGFGVITYSYAGNGTLAAATDTSTAFAITKAPASVTATGQSKIYGQTIAFGAASTNFTATGLQNGETIGTVTLAVTGSGGVSNAPVSGSPYTITPSAATGGTFNSGNYAITYNPGLLTVNPLPVALTGTRAYDGTATAVFNVLSVTNALGTDVVTAASGSVTLASTAVGVEPITSASGLTLGGAEAGDYTTVGAVGAVTITNSFQPFSILSIQVVTTNAVVVFQSVPGVTYQMLTSPDPSLPVPDWADAGVPMTATDVVTTNIVPVGGTNQFYIIQY